MGRSRGPSVGIFNKKFETNLLTIACFSRICFLSNVGLEQATGKVGVADVLNSIFLWE